MKENIPPHVVRAACKMPLAASPLAIPLVIDFPMGKTARNRESSPCRAGNVLKATHRETLEACLEEKCAQTNQLVGKAALDDAICTSCSASLQTLRGRRHNVQALCRLATAARPSAAPSAGRLTTIPRCHCKPSCNQADTFGNHSCTTHICFFISSREAT